MFIFSVPHKFARHALRVFVSKIEWGLGLCPNKSHTRRV